PLFVANRFDVEVNLMDVLFGDQLSIKGITLEQPQILVKVLPDGRANYDIAMPSADTVSAANDEPAKFSLAIERWQIIDGDLTYDDQSLTFRMDLKHLNHTGSGNFNEQQFDL
ncbi:MAG TPA: membrane biogenesis protein, partial [Cytophagales bacterium]|nr:membrane biogenesis protein [Cytophagales bacterium]